MASTVIHSISNFLDQNFYGFMLLLIAADLDKVGEREGATAFFGAGATLLGIKRTSPESLTTISTNPPTTTVTTGSTNG